MEEPQAPPPPPAPLPDAAIDEVLSAWWNFSQAMKRHFTPALQREYQLEFKDFVVLSAIQEGASYPGLICSRFSMTPSAVSRLIDELVGGDLIARRIDQHDSRRVQLSLTAKGETVLAGARHTMQQVLRRGLDPLEAGQIQVFAEVLRHLSRALSQTDTVQTDAVQIDTAQTDTPPAPTAHEGHA